MPRFPAKQLAAGALGMLLVLTTAGAASGDTRRAVVTVSSPEFVYTDLTKPGRLVMRGFDRTSTTVDHVELGFNAYRSVDAGDDDAAHTQDVSAHVDAQQITVLVDVVRAGDLSVFVRGRARNDLDPRPVTGSAVPAAQETARGFVWTIRDAQAGMHRFSAALAPNPGPRAAARFVPEVIVERTSRQHSYARHLRGAVRAPSSVTTVNRLRLTQIAGDAAAPDITVPPVREPVASPSTSAKALSTEMTLVANGPRPVGGPPAKEQRALEPRDHVAFEPVMTFTMAGQHAMSGRKADWALTFDPFGWWVYHLATADLTLENPREPHREPPPAGLYEGDAAQVAAIASFAPNSTAQRAGEPGSGGRLVAREPAVFADAMDYLTHNEVQGFEPSRTDIDTVRDPRSLWRAELTSATSVSFLAQGDIDNRAGTRPIDGDDVFIANPEGFTPTAAIAVAGTTGNPLPIQYDAELSERGMTITPRVDAGQYVLESGRNADGTVDWATHVSVVIFYSPAWSQDSGPAPVVTQRVDAGATATVLVLDADGSRRRLQLGPGDHVVRVGPESAPR